MTGHGSRDNVMSVIAFVQSHTYSKRLNVLFPSFYFLGYTKYRESIAFAQKIDFQILMNVHVLRPTESKKVIFGMSSVCLSVCGHHNSKNN